MLARYLWRCYWVWLLHVAIQCRGSGTQSGQSAGMADSTPECSPGNVVLSRPSFAWLASQAIAPEARAILGERITARMPSAVIDNSASQLQIRHGPGPPINKWGQGIKSDHFIRLHPNGCAVLEACQRCSWRAGRQRREGADNPTGRIPRPKLQMQLQHNFRAGWLIPKLWQMRKSTNSLGLH